MSMNFDEPLSEAQQKIRDQFFEDAQANVAASDDKTTLFEHFNMQREKLSKLANDVGQPVKVEINGEGDTKTMSDGTEYRCTPQGWKKVDPTDV